ncbi:MAG: GNAT family N-acetyltransferase [Acidobacteria bacterium]|nr:GNAT family N-acetyltransferase [Acidobacteriota bacterium]
MEIKLRTCALRYWRRGDEASLVRHADNYQIWRSLRDRFPHPYTSNDARKWIEHTLAEDPPLNLAITINHEAVGGIGIIPGSDIHHRSAEIGYWLGEAYWGRGIVTEAVKAASQWAFENYDLNRLWAGVFEYNAASARVLVKAGFKFEARLRGAATKEGRTLDELLYALVRE